MGGRAGSLADSRYWNKSPSLLSWATQMFIAKEPFEPQLNPETVKAAVSLFCNQHWHPVSHSMVRSSSASQALQGMQNAWHRRRDCKVATKPRHSAGLVQTHNRTKELWLERESIAGGTHRALEGGAK